MEYSVEMSKPSVKVILYTIPMAACDSKKMNWNDVANLIKIQLKTFFGEAASFVHLEFMTPEWFSDEPAQQMLESGEVNFPFVLVNGEVACSEKKVNISKIRRCVQSKLSL